MIKLRTDELRRTYTWNAAVPQVSPVEVRQPRGRDRLKGPKIGIVGRIQ
jgi:hypothetical protein